MKYNSRGTDYNRKSPSLLHTATSRYNTQNDAMKSQKYVSGSAPSLDQLKILHKIPPQKHSPTIPAVVCAQRHAATRHFEPLIAARQLQHVGRCTIRRFRSSSGDRNGGRRLRKPVEAARDPAKNVSVTGGDNCVVCYGNRHVDSRRWGSALQARGCPIGFLYAHAFRGHKPLPEGRRTYLWACLYVLTVKTLR